MRGEKPKKTFFFFFFLPFAYMAFPSTDLDSFKFLCPGKLDEKIKNLMVGFSDLNKA